MAEEIAEAMSDNSLNSAPITDSIVSADAQPQLQPRLLQMATQLGHMQAQLDELLAESQTSGNQVAVLTQTLTSPATNQPLQERLAELATQIQINSEQVQSLAQTVVAMPNREQLDSLAQTFSNVARQDQLTQLAEALTKVASHEQLVALANKLATQEEVTDLADNVKRLSRTQFKTNALTESKEQQTTDALAILQSIATRREEMQADRAWRDQQRLDTLNQDARGDLATDLLPALDGLELALENGRVLLEKQPHQPSPAPRPVPTRPPEAPPGLLTRLGRAIRNEPAPAPPQLALPLPIDTRADELRASLAAWLEGLDLVRERFLSLLSGESIQPIDALNQSFDPRQHVAVESTTSADAPPNTVVRVVRKGYRHKERVLRYAEVVVTRTEP